MTILKYSEFEYNLPLVVRLLMDLNPGSTGANQQLGTTGLSLVSDPRGRSSGYQARHGT